MAFEKQEPQGANEAGAIKSGWWKNGKIKGWTQKSQKPC